MRDKLYLNKNFTSSSLYYSTGPSNEIFLRVSFVLIVAMLFLLNGLFYYLVMCKCMITTVCVNGTVQFTFFLS